MGKNTITMSVRRLRNQHSLIELMTITERNQRVQVGYARRTEGSNKESGRGSSQKSCTSFRATRESVSK
jgi:hypothetical protein